MQFTHYTRLCLRRGKIPGVEAAHIFLVLGPIKRRDVRAFKRTGRLSHHAREGRVCFQNCSALASQAHGLAGRFPDGTKLSLRFEQLLLGPMARRYIYSGGDEVLQLAPAVQQGPVGERNPPPFSRFGDPLPIEGGSDARGDQAAKMFAALFSSFRADKYLPIKLSL